MSISVEIPTPLRRFTGGVAKLDSGASSLSELVIDLEGRFPGIAKHLRDEAGQIRPFLNIYVNEEDIRFLGGESYRFKEGDKVLLVPSIAGG